MRFFDYYCYFANDSSEFSLKSCKIWYTATFLYCRNSWIFNAIFLFYPHPQQLFQGTSYIGVNAQIQNKPSFKLNLGSSGSRYSIMDQVKFMEDSLQKISNLLKAVFHKFYLVHSWIRWPICFWNIVIPEIYHSDDILREQTGWG